MLGRRGEAGVPAHGGRRLTGLRTGDGAWFRRLHPAHEGGPGLLCFPHAGGSAVSYRKLSELLSPPIEVAGVQYPGRQERGREVVHTDLVELAARIADELDGPPPAFFGHSMGAALAFEVARRMDTAPPVLFVSGRRAPSRSIQEREHPMSDQDILADLRRLGGTEAKLLRSRSLLRAVVPVLRGDYEAIDTYEYVPGPPLPCPIVVLAGDADPLTPVEYALDWHEHSTAQGGSHVFPGGHFFLDDHRDRVAEIVREWLVP